MDIDEKAQYMICKMYLLSQKGFLFVFIHFFFQIIVVKCIYFKTTISLISPILVAKLRHLNSDVSDLYFCLKVTDIYIYRAIYQINFHNLLKFQTRGYQNMCIIVALVQKCSASSRQLFLIFFFSHMPVFQKANKVKQEIILQKKQA